MAGIRQTDAGVVIADAGVAQTVVAGVEIIDDFEDYADDSEVQTAWGTSSVALETANPVESNQSLTSNTTQAYATNPDYTSVDDEFWSIDVQFNDATADTIGILLHIQDDSNSGTILDDCVRVRMDLQDAEMDVQVYENGSFQTQNNPSTGSLATGTRYRIGAMLTASGEIVTEVWNVETNVQLVDDTLAYDPGWDSGIPGVYIQNNGLAAADYLRTGGGDDGGSPGAVVLADWESGSIGSEWTEDSAGWVVESDSTLGGANNLAAEDTFAYLYSLEGDGLPAYPSRGSRITYRTYATTSGSADQTLGIDVGMVDTANGYFTRHTGTNLELIEYVGGTDNTISSTDIGNTPGQTVLRWELEWDDGSTFGGSAGDMTLTVIDESDGSTVGTTSGTSTNVEDATGSNGAGVGIWYDDSEKLRMDDLEFE